MARKATKQSRRTKARKAKQAGSKPARKSPVYSIGHAPLDLMGGQAMALAAASVLAKRPVNK